MIGFKSICGSRSIGLLAGREDNVNFQKPGPNKRVCAFIIDSIIGQVFGGIFAFMMAKDVGWMLYAIFILTRDSLNGQSIGKILVGLQVVEQNYSPVSPAKTILRNISMAIPLVPLIEYYVMLNDKAEGKRLGDLLAKTRVHDLKPERKDSAFLWISVALFVALVAIQVSCGLLLTSQHPELLKK